jgi:hypothetical protein
MQLLVVYETGRTGSQFFFEADSQFDQRFSGQFQLVVVESVRHEKPFLRYVNFPDILGIDQIAAATMEDCMIAVNLLANQRPYILQKQGNTLRIKSVMLFISGSVGIDFTPRPVSFYKNYLAERESVYFGRPPNDY